MRAADLIRDSIHCYRMLTMRLAARTAAAAQDTQRAHACAFSASSRWFGLADGDLAYSIAREGIFDDRDSREPRRHALRCALRGAIHGNQVRLLKYLHDRRAAMNLMCLTRTVWLEAQQGLLFGLRDVNPAIVFAAQGDTEAAEKALALCGTPEESSAREILHLAAEYGSARVLRWSLRYCIDNKIIGDASSVLCRALLGGRGQIASFWRHVQRPAEKYFAISVASGGHERAAAGLLRITGCEVVARGANALLVDLVVAACLHPSLRILAFAARRLPHGTFLQTLAGCKIGDAYFVSKDMECVSDARLRDAVACVEFLLLFRRAPRFNRGRLLAFQSPRKALFARAAPALAYRVKSRVGFSA